MSASEVRRFINSLPDKRAAIQMLGALEQLIPNNKDTALTAHAGGGQADALVLRSDAAFHDVATVASAADSVVLPYPKVGDMHFVKNSAAANAMTVYAVTPGTIDSVATGTGVSQLAGDGVLYVCVVDGNYVRLGGVSSSEVFTSITATSAHLGVLNATIIGSSTAAAGTFTALVATSAHLGSLDATAIGSATAAHGGFTSLVATSAHLGSLDATAIGSATAAHGGFSSLVATSAHLTSVDDTIIGAGTAAAGTFTSLTATGAASIAGSATTDVGFHGAAGTARAANVTALVSAATASFGSTAEANAAIDAINALLVLLKNKGLMATS
jgi:hypothetical protein